MKIDLSKSYDRVRWICISILLTHLGFILLIFLLDYELHSLVFFSVLKWMSLNLFSCSNTSSTKMSIISSDLLLVIEWLSQILGETKRRGSLKGLCVVIGFYTSHLFLVDDILIFCDGTRRYATMVKDALVFF